MFNSKHYSDNLLRNSHHNTSNDSNTSHTALQINLTALQFGSSHCKLIHCTSIWFIALQINTQHFKFDLMHFKLTHCTLGWFNFQFSTFNFELQFNTCWTSLIRLQCTSMHLCDQYDSIWYSMTLITWPTMRKWMPLTSVSH